MNRKEISIIIRTAEGITRALNELAQGDDALAAAVGDMADYFDRPFRCSDAGYYAIMWLEQQRREEQRGLMGWNRTSDPGSRSGPPSGPGAVFRRC